MINRFTKIAAVATIAAAAAAPMAMAASTFKSGTITGMDKATDTISIDGAKYHLNTGAANGMMFKVGEGVMFKTETKGTMASVTAMKPAKDMTTGSAMGATTGTSKITSGEAKAEANGLSGKPVKADTSADATINASASGEQKTASHEKAVSGDATVETN
ncbi:hypothetical protein [Acidimangrovimonas sediminis]|uniref:hypothetical protein n=1 Tax=Acidimangrovimonas sediminis TaxID=2056283 RepID=UPI000C80C30A|nr:hypothetical protein [Acidimangrovimonas sediminis]